jgi:hypothetical protein
MKQFIKDNKPYCQSDRADLTDYYLTLGCEEVNVLYSDNFIKPFWNGSEFIESATVEEEEALKAPIYEKDIISRYKYLNTRALSSSMGKYGDFEYLQFQKLEYDNKYKVATGEVINQPIADTINKERLRDYPAGTIDPILLSYGITPADTEIGKMYQLIVFRYTYAKNLYDTYLGFATDFRTKCRTFVELREWDKLETAFAMVDSLEEEITLEQIQTTYASFDAL